MKNKVFVIGLDGATFDLIDPWIEQGDLPNLARILNEGAKVTLRSTIPPKTAPAWLSMITGMNPANHGVFDFVNYDARKYTALEDGVVIGANACSGKTIWDVVSKQEGRVGVIGVPMTYPAWQVNGFMIGDNVKADLKKHGYPEDMSEQILTTFLSDPKFYRLQQTDLKKYAEGSLDIIRRRIPLVMSLYKKEQYDFFMACFDAPDRSQHIFWKYLALIDHEFSSIIFKHYEVFDKALGEIINSLDDETTLFIASDHGFCESADKFFNTNCWLKKEGLLKEKVAKTQSMKNGLIKFLIANLKKRLGKHEIRSLSSFIPNALKREVVKISQDVEAIDWENTLAYRFNMTPPSEGIVINVKNRQKCGIVEPGSEYENFRNKIITKLQSLQCPDNGSKLITEIYKREQIFQGPYLERAPDIIFLLTTGYRGGKEMLNIFTKVPHEELNVWNGQHAMNGIFIAWGNNIKKIADKKIANMVDVAPTIIYSLGLNIPSYVDGHVLTEIFTSEYTSKNKIQFFESGTTTPGDHGCLPEEDEKNVMEKLRGLGYLN